MNYLNTEKTNNQRGAAAVLLVIVISAAALVVAKNAAWVGVGETELSYQHSMAQETLMLAESCAADMLRRVQLDNDLTAAGLNLTQDEGYCLVNVSGTEVKTITVKSNIGNYYNSLNVNARIVDGEVLVDVWEEI